MTKKLSLSVRLTIMSKLGKMASFLVCRVGHIGIVGMSSDFVDLPSIDISIRREPNSSQFNLDAPSVASLVNPYCDGYLFKHGVTYGCWPTWKRRYCIVKGGFLFKFSSPNSSKPKGTPIPLTDCEIDGVDLPAAAAAAAKKADPSANVQHTLYGVRLSTLIHEYTFGCVSEEERSHWIRKLRTHKQLAIKQMMGHAPVSADEQFAAKSGSNLVQKKTTRVQAKAAEDMDRHSNESLTRTFMPM